MNRIKIAVCGAGGKMGRRIIALGHNNGEFEVVGATELEGSPLIGQDCGTLAGVGACNVEVTDNLKTAASTADVVLDFTAPKATINNVKSLPANVKAMVIGTTGFSEDELKILQETIKDKKIVCVFSPNMSTGINLLFALVRKAAAALKDKYDVEIVEYHHNLKKDAPSGTAKRFGEIVAAAQDSDYEDRVQHGRQGGMALREKKEIGMHAVRAGEIVGEHTIMFAGCSEIIEFRHTALSRDTLAQGALAAAKFAANAAPGWYSMEDVFGIK